MQFKLDNTLTDDIIFNMENQEGEFLLDTQEATVIDINNNDFDEEPDFNDGERFIPLPEWSSAEGYRLMEKFTSSLKSSALRHELSVALNKNKGVFRFFKNTLEKYPETEKLWFSFKEREMKRVVTDWYNALREEWGLEPIGSEPEDTSSLILEDFVFKEGKEDGSINFSAETAAGEVCGKICGKLEENSLHIKTLEVKPEYRGMGIGKTLLLKILEKADEQKLTVIIDLPQESDFFARALHLEEFKPVMQRYVRVIGIR